ncbi:unnamed protein product [Auanema sp. JU1783]|nr:unnamed protein product [Auanema sp. JU1783]
MWFFIIQNVYGLLSIIFYIVVINLTVRERRYFNSSFVKIFVTLGVVNILSYIAIYVTVRLPQQIHQNSDLSEFFASFPFPTVLAVAHFLTYYSCYVKNLTIVLMILNRLRSIACPFSREAIWDIHFWITVVFVLLFPLPFCYGILFNKSYYAYNRELDGYFISSHAQQDDDLLKLTIFQCVITILCVILNLSSILILCQRSMSSNYKRELNLLSVTFLAFTFQTLTSITMAALYITPKDSMQRALAIFILPFCNDLFCLTFPYFFLILNARVRKCFFEMSIFNWINDSYHFLSNKSDSEPSTFV